MLIYLSAGGHTERTGRAVASSNRTNTGALPTPIVDYKKELSHRPVIRRGMESESEQHRVISVEINRLSEIMKMMGLNEEQHPPPAFSDCTSLSLTQLRSRLAVMRESIRRENAMMEDNAREIERLKVVQSQLLLQKQCLQRRASQKHEPFAPPPGPMAGD